jgi:hypothetical protein
MRNVLPSFVALLALSAASVTFSAVHAHGGTQPEHGGVVQLVGDMTFELAVRADGVELYVEDDGDEVTSAEMAAKLTIVDAGVKSEVMLTPAAGNKFEAKGVKIAGGAKVAVLLTLKDKQSKIGANFTIK